MSHVAESPASHAPAARSPRVRRPLVNLCSLLPALALACGGIAMEGGGAPDGSGGRNAGAGGHGATGGHVATGGTSSGGAGIGGLGTGSLGNGGSGVGGGSVTAKCNADADCVAVFDTSAPCFSFYCSAPFPASREDLARNRCLMDWADRGQPAPDGCAPSGVFSCPELCAAPTHCAFPQCDAGLCKVDMGGDPGVCSKMCTPAREGAEKAIKVAAGCNPSLDSVQCDGSEKIYLPGTCSCGEVLNETQPDLVQAARDALKKYTDACDVVEPPCFPGLCDGPPGSYCASEGVCRRNQ